MKDELTIEQCSAGMTEAELNAMRLGTKIALFAIGAVSIAVIAAIAIKTKPRD
jgi:hypothetical protein